MTALKIIDDQREEDRPKVLTALISEDTFYYIHTFFVESIDILQDSNIGQESVRMPYFPKVGRTTLTQTKNHNRAFRVLHFDKNGKELMPGMERKSLLKRCFKVGTCVMKVRVLENSFWNIIGHFDIWLNLVVLNPNGSLVKQFLKLLPDQIKHDIDQSEEKNKQRKKKWPSKEADEFGGMNKAKAWAYMNMGSVLALNAMCKERFFFQHYGKLHTDEILKKADENCETWEGLARQI